VLRPQPSQAKALRDDPRVGPRAVSGITSGQARTNARHTLSTTFTFLFLTIINKHV
jgi:hypothetical protein